MVESEFTLEELLGFIENKKPANFWKNIGKAFKNDGRKNVKKKGVFGVPLEVIIERDGAESTDGVGPGTLRIPAVVDDIISSMKQMDLSVEGVFRKNGNIKKLGEIVEKLDKEEEVDFSSTHVVQVAALLKRYLRELPDPLMTHKLYRLWLAAAKIQDEQKMRHCLHLTCCLLPKANRDCLEILFCFLKWVGSFHQVDDESGSKMDIKNLATVIAPNVLFDRNKLSSLDSDPMFAIEAVEMLIANIGEMCLVRFSRFFLLPHKTNRPLGPRRSRRHPERPGSLQPQRGSHHQGNPQEVLGPSRSRAWPAPVRRSHRDRRPARDPHPPTAEANGNRPVAVAAGKQRPARPRADNTLWPAPHRDAAAEAWRTLRRPAASAISVRRPVRPPASGHARGQWPRRWRWPAAAAAGSAAAEGMAQLGMGETE
jgi:hypothetical protein